MRTHVTCDLKPPVCNNYRVFSSNFSAKPRRWGRGIGPKVRRGENLEGGHMSITMELFPALEVNWEI